MNGLGIHPRSQLYAKAETSVLFFLQSSQMIWMKVGIDVLLYSVGLFKLISRVPDQNGISQASSIVKIYRSGP